MAFTSNSRIQSLFATVKRDSIRNLLHETVISKAVTHSRNLIIFLVHEIQKIIFLWREKYLIHSIRHGGNLCVDVYVCILCVFVCEFVYLSFLINTYVQYIGREVKRIGVRNSLLVLSAFSFFLLISSLQNSINRNSRS